MPCCQIQGISDYGCLNWEAPEFGFAASAELAAKGMNQKRMTNWKTGFASEVSEECSLSQGNVLDKAESSGSFFLLCWC